MPETLNKYKAGDKVLFTLPIKVRDPLDLNPFSRRTVDATIELEGTVVGVSELGVAVHYQTNKLKNGLQGPRVVNIEFEKIRPKEE